MNKVIRIIFGLGNPLGKYRRTPHNIGLECVNYFLDSTVTSNMYVIDRIEFASGTLSIISNGTFLLGILTPKLFINSSGEVLSDAYKEAKKRSFEISSSLVAYDEFDLSLGTIKVGKLSNKITHNGIRSIYSFSLENDFNIKLLKLGIGKKSGSVKNLFEFVLTNFDIKEIKVFVEPVKRFCVSVFNNFMDKDSKTSIEECSNMFIYRLDKEDRVTRLSAITNEEREEACKKAGIL